MLQQKLTRRQFLMGLIGFAAAIIGVPTIMGALSHATQTANPSRMGYGKQHYGP
jgi:hypothetical protein